MLGDRLKNFAIFKYGSVTKLAEVSGIVQPQLSSYTSGKKKPSVNILEKLLNTGCNINWLISGEGEMIYSIDYKSKPSTAISKSFKKKTSNSEKLTNEEIRALKSLLEKKKKTSSRNVG